MSRGTSVTPELSDKQLSPLPVSEHIGEIIAVAETLMAKPEWMGQSDTLKVLGETAMRLVRRMHYLGRHPHLARILWSSPIPVTRGPIAVGSDGAVTLEGLYTPQMLSKDVILNDGHSVKSSSYSLFTPLIGKRPARTLTIRHHVSNIGKLGDIGSLEPNNVSIVIPDTEVGGARAEIFTNSDEESPGSDGGLIDYAAFAANFPELAGKRRPAELAVVLPLGVLAMAGDAIDPPKPSALPAAA